MHELLRAASQVATTSNVYKRIVLQCVLQYVVWCRGAASKLATTLTVYSINDTVCCSVLQCVAVCCSVLQCVAVCCSVLQCVAVCCSVLQCLEKQRVSSLLQ